MEFLFDKELEFDAAHQDGESIPEIRVVSSNANRMHLLERNFENCVNKLNNFANERKRDAIRDMKSDSISTLLAQGTTAIKDLVFECDDPFYMKLYLFFCGLRLVATKKYRDGIRYLEVANSIELKGALATMQLNDQLKFTIENQLKTAYANTGQYRKYLALGEASEDAREVKSRLKILRNKPFPVWQEDADYNTPEWEIELFGSSNSRSLSCDVTDGKLVAKRDFNFGELIFVDKPVVGYVEDTKGQCNVCALKTLHTVPCTNCRAVFYCSLECLRKDAHFHQYECLGYRLLLFPLLNIMLVHHMMVKALDVLKLNLSLRDPSTVQPSTAEQLWEALLEHHDYSEDFLIVLQGCACTQYTEDKNTFRSLLQRAKLVLCYIMHNEQLIDDYRTCWTNLPQTERNIFLESVLLRLTCCAYSGTCSFKYELAYDKTDVVDMLMSRFPALDSDSPNSKIDQYTTVERSAAYPTNLDSLLMYWDYCWAEANREAKTAGELDIVDRALKLYSGAYHSTFDFVQHLAMSRSAPTVTSPNKYIGLYSFQWVFEAAAAEPNTLYVLLDHGAIAFRAITEIKKGETLRLVRSNVYNQPKPAMKWVESNGLKQLKSIIDIKIIGDPMTEEARLICKIDIMSKLISNDSHKSYSCNSNIFFEYLFILDCFKMLYYNISRRSKECAQIFKLLIKVDTIYNHARVLPYVLMQDDWLAQLIKRGPKLRSLKQQNNENVATELFKMFFK